MKRILYKILAFVSFGFYVHPLALNAFENPAHPRNADEIQREQRKEYRENDPMKPLETEEQKKSNDDGSSKWVTHEDEDPLRK